MTKASAHGLVRGFASLLLCSWAQSRPAVDAFSPASQGLGRSFPRGNIIEENLMVLYMPASPGVGTTVLALVHFRKLTIIVIACLFIVWLLGDKDVSSSRSRLEVHACVRICQGENSVGAV
ncbi:hypothetical protein K440DRAFT_640161 [Wilcoxina mikolae CBS 423.85]|nr:hypothetical protein K440DRAFT_640161 [Wilcoxina mikolae CBS 423.85]